MGKVTKPKKLKISSVKRSNHLRAKSKKRGKVKGQCYGQLKNRISKTPRQSLPKVVEHKEEESDYGEDLIDMIEEDDLNFLKQAVSNKSYSLLKQIRCNDVDRNKQGRKKKRNDTEKSIETFYEEGIAKISEEMGTKKVRMLLPVKVKNGTIEKRIIEEDDIDDNEQAESNEIIPKNQEEENSDMEIASEFEKTNDGTEQVTSTIELLACREEALNAKRLKIGLLSTSLLENPELKSSNFKALLDLMDEYNPEVYVTVRKLATVSLLEVFKDLLPSYHILQFQQEGVKFKKETLQLQNYESTLLKSYKTYLQKLERMCGAIRRKRGDTRPVKDNEIQLSELAVKCMCELVISHPYFNFATNIINFLIPLLDNKRPSVRITIANCISQVFKEDKRGELSLSIVKKINQFIKLKSHCIHTEVISVLLSLRIKDVNLDKEKEEDYKIKKLTSHKQRILSLSKRERKRNKKLEEVEKELLETKAEENKLSKQKILTEITSMVFTIYFRILKQAPNSKILSVCLEGLAKFAHCINLDFYQDLVTVIDKLMEESELGLREQLHCILCVFTILSGQGSALAIDPYRFYVHLYKIILKVHMGKTHGEMPIALDVLVKMFIARRKRISQARLIAFVKRIILLCIQLQHNGALGALAIVKQIMQLSKAADILLDTDSTTGDGFYQAELEEPEYCNAHCTALWELAALQRHYHPAVQKFARNIAHNVPVNGEGSLPSELSKLTPSELYAEFDPSGMAFKPAVPAPKKMSPKSCATSHELTNNELKKYINHIHDEEMFVNGYIDFFNGYNNK